MKPCNQCGKCCTNSHFMGTMRATVDDLERWEAEGRDDILQYHGGFGDLWIHPETNEELFRCPFVRKVPNQPRYMCRIYETRPEACRNYPLRIDHMKFVDCEMLEPGDTVKDIQRLKKKTPEQYGEK